MRINQFEIWLANLNPQKGTESGKKRPVLIIQSNLLNHNFLPSTLICPITTNVIDRTDILRVHLLKKASNLNYDSDVLIDQIRSIDNTRFIEKMGVLSTNLIDDVKENLKTVLDL